MAEVPVYLDPYADSALDREARRLLGDFAQGEVMRAAQIDLLDQIKAALFTLTKASSKTMAAFIGGIRDGIPTLKTEVDKVHQRVGEQVQEAILGAYDNSLLGTPPYRVHAILSKNRRYAGGILRSVLASPNFVTADSSGISIGNTRELDARARQWRRLNYGAGSAAGGDAGIVAVRWSNQEFYLAEPGAPRPAFRIPAGAWFGQEFYPVSELQARFRLVSHLLGQGKVSSSQAQSSFEQLRGGIRQEPRYTRGIRGKHFMAAGLEVAAEALPRGYNDAMKVLFKSGDEAVRKAIFEAGASRPGETGVRLTVNFVPGGG